MNVIVIGGGASGLMAALTAARNGHAVTLLERQSRVGRKLLSTGNGRCNLTNLHVAPVHYHGLSPDFVRPALDAFDTGAALAFFHGLGLLTVAEDSGRVYPYSDQAGSVLDLLPMLPGSLPARALRWSSYAEQSTALPCPLPRKRWQRTGSSSAAAAWPGASWAAPAAGISFCSPWATI